jgi:axial budding pattern protein 2
LRPSAPFNISFSSDVFKASGSKLSYYATLSDHTPLPAWISFDEPSLQFGGITPATSIPQAFNVSLIASDTPGYAAASLSFTISISNHQMVFAPISQTINLTKGDDVHITNLKSKLQLDQSPISDRDIKSAIADIPSWLTFDNHSFDITGKAPSDVSSRDLTITATDIYGDTAEHTIHLGFASKLFANEIGVLNITIGQPFEMKLPQNILTDGTEKVTLNFGALSGELKFDSDTLTISGTVSSDILPQAVQCSLIAVSEDGSTKEVQMFRVELLRASGITSGTNFNQSTDGSIFEPDKPKDKGQKPGLIVGVVIASIFGALMIFTFIFCLFRKRNQIRGHLSPKPPKSPRKSDISRPTFIPTGWPHANPYDNPDLEKGNTGRDPFIRRTQEHPPKIDLNLTVSRRDSHTAAESINDGERRMLDSFEESSYGHIRGDSAPSDRPSGPMKIPTESAKRSSQNSANSFRRHKRRATTVYHDQIHRSTGLPVNRRITGMGMSSRRDISRELPANTLIVSKSPVRSPWARSNWTGDSEPRPLPKHMLTELPSRVMGATPTPHPGAATNFPRSVGQ